MRRLPLSPLAQRLGIGAIVLTVAGLGVSLLTTKTAPPTSAPAANAPLVDASAPAALAASTAVTSAAPANVPDTAPLEIATLTAPGKASATRKFPFVTSGHGDVAARINNQLFIQTFEMLAPARASDGLREITAPMWQSRPEINFKVQRNDGRIFSVALTSEGCGAYCESYTTSHAFDAASGRHLRIEDLFSDAGRATLGKQFKAAHLAAIRAEITRLKNPQAKGNSKQALPKERAEATTMYEGCAQQQQSPEYGSSLATSRMQIQAQAVVFSAERCSNHAMRALDKLGDFSFRLSPAQFTPWLSAYGRYLLLGGDASGFSTPTSPWEQVLRGKLGDKLPVTLYIDAPNPDGSLEGHYFYDRYRKPIALSGHLKEETLTLTEADSKEAPAPRLVLTPQGNALRGNWEGATTLDVTLQP